MFGVRAFGSVRVPDMPWVVLATADGVGSSEISAADFRDTHALFHRESGRFVGVDSSGTMWLGKTPISMIDGVWYMEIDGDARYEMIPAASLELRIIA